MNCLNCNTQNIPNVANFCPNCGSQLKHGKFAVMNIGDSAKEESLSSNEQGILCENFLTKKLGKNLIFTAYGISFLMVYVQGGTFTMGATAEQGNDALPNEYPTHRVTLSDFYIAETEVTQTLWFAIMGNNPSRYCKGGNFPVAQVSREDCEKFINRLSALSQCQYRFRLPTEDEWEYAARGGQNSCGYKYAGSNCVGKLPPPGEFFPVKTHKPNELGLYDMCGNLLEWCADDYMDYSINDDTNPLRCVQLSNHSRTAVVRGGGSVSRWCRVSQRHCYCSPDKRYPGVGLRLAMQING